MLARRAELVRIPSPPEPLSIVDVVFGVVSAVVETLRNGMSSGAAPPSTSVDAFLEVTWRGWTLAARAAQAAGDAAAPLARLVADPPLVPHSLRPISMAHHAAEAWRGRRPTVVDAAVRARDATLPPIVDTLTESIDLTDLVTSRVDLGRVVTDALDQLDLTGIVLDRVDLERVAVEVLNALDLDAVARERLDLMGLAEYVVDGIDLPGIIRDSTGSMASESIRTVRLQSIDADEAVQRLVDRLLLWRRGRAVQAPDRSAGGTPE